MRRDDQRLDWADVSADLIVVVAEDDPAWALAMGRAGPSPPASPSSAWDVREAPSRLWTTANVRTLYQTELQAVARQLAAHRQRRTPRPD